MPARPIRCKPPRHRQRPMTDTTDQGPYPPGSGLPQARHPVLRHLDPAGPWPRPGARRWTGWPRSSDRITPDMLVGIESRGFLVAAPLAYRAGLRLRHGAQERQAAGRRHPAQLRARIRHRHGRDPGRCDQAAASASSCSTICWRPAAPWAAIDLLRKVGAEVLRCRLHHRAGLPRRPAPSRRAGDVDRPIRPLAIDTTGVSESSSDSARSYATGDPVNTSFSKIYSK